MSFSPSASISQCLAEHRLPVRPHAVYRVTLKKEVQFLTSNGRHNWDFRASPSGSRTSEMEEGEGVSVTPAGLELSEALCPTRGFSPSQGRLRRIVVCPIPLTGASSRTQPNVLIHSQLENGAKIYINSTIEEAVGTLSLFVSKTKKWNWNSNCRLYCLFESFSSDSNIFWSPADVTPQHLKNNVHERRFRFRVRKVYCGEAGYI